MFSVILVGIDTCGGTGSLAVARVMGRVVEVLGASELAGRTTAAELVPALGAMMARAGVAGGEVGGIVVVDGPGSFTGIRIGLSTAKGLAEGWGAPVFAVSRLRVLVGVDGAGAAALDAGRGEFYFGRYGGTAVAESSAAGEAGEWLLTEGELAAELLPGGGACGLAVCEEKVAGVFALARRVGAPTAADAIRVALPAVLAGQSSEVAGLDGRYVRRSDLYRRAAASGAPVA